MRLLLPGPVWELLLAVFSAFALTTVFVRDWENTTAAYVVYAVSTYALTVITARLTLLFCSGRRRLREHETYRRYRADSELRMRVSIRISLAVTLPGFCSRSIKPMSGRAVSERLHTSAGQ